MYQRNWEAFTHFLSTHMTPGNVFPATGSQVALFLVFLHHQKGLAYSTMRTYTSAIAFTHKIAGQDDPTDTFLVAKALQGIRNQQPGSTRMPLLPLTKEILHECVDALPYAAPNPYDATLWKALFLLSFHACLRAGEVTLSNTGKNILQRHQVTLTNRAITIQFLAYKHSRGKTPALTIEATNSPHCPFVALHNYLQKRPAIPGNLFLHQNGTIVTRQQFANILTSSLTMSGQPAHRFNTHSFRAGRATQLAADNHSDSTIRSAGRWTSTAFQHYVRPTTVVLPQ
jgi:integrase